MHKAGGRVIALPSLLYFALYFITNWVCGKNNLQQR
jgi:hypothetical protein